MIRGFIYGQVKETNWVDKTCCDQQQQRAIITLRCGEAKGRNTECGQAEVKSVDVAIGESCLIVLVEKLGHCHKSPDRKIGWGDTHLPPLPPSENWPPIGQIHSETKGQGNAWRVHRGCLPWAQSRVGKSAQWDCGLALASRNPLKRLRQDRSLRNTNTKGAGRRSLRNCIQKGLDENQERMVLFKGRRTS